MADRGWSGSLRAYAALLAAQVRAQRSYRASFGVDVASNIMTFGADLMTVLVLFRVTPTMGGFRVGEVLLMFGLASCAFQLANVTVGNIERIPLYIRMGLLDGVLVRPLSVLGQLVLGDFALRKAARLISAVILLAVVASSAEIDWTPARVALLALAPIMGAALFGAIFVASATVAFWWTESAELTNSVTYAGRDFTAYPVTVFGGWFRRIFAFGLGFAFVAYYPALALLDRPDPAGGPAWLGWSAPPLVALAGVSVAGLVWRLAIRHYRSTGS